jgi:hypothetical protein
MRPSNEAEPLRKTYPLVPQAAARIRSIAEDVLRRALSVLVEERVVPRSRYRPWIRMAKDYYGHAVSDSELAEALKLELPERFAERFPSTDYRWGYGGALVEAAVAAATVADDPYDVASPSVQRVLDEFVEKLQATPRSTVLVVVSDLDVEHATVPPGEEDRLGESLEIAGVRVVRVENKPERFIEQALPSAGYEVERTDVVAYPGPAVLLISNVVSADDTDARLAIGRARVTRLLAALRLATATTARALLVADGEPDRVHRYRPQITPLRQPWFRYGHRPVTIINADVTPIEELCALVEQVESSTTSLRLALGRFGRSLDETSTNLPDQVVDISVGLEAALAGREKTEVSLRLRLRAAQLLSTDADRPEQIFADVRELYDLRSTIVHGATLTEAAIEKAIRKVSGTARGRGAAEIYTLALDRWRDLLRRAIVARIALNSATPPWAVGRREAQVDVDQHLSSDEGRIEWKRHVRDYWAERGLASVVDAAPQMRLSLGGESRSNTAT